MNTYFKIVSLALIWIFCNHAYCDDTKQMQDFIEGNAAYGQKNYTEAINFYQEALKQGTTVPLLFNLANAYAQDRQTGLAMVNYKRALLYAPRNADVRANLALLSQYSSIPEFPPCFGQSIVTRLTHATWLYLGSAAFWIFLFLGCGVYFYAIKKTYIYFLIVVSFVGLIFASYAVVLSSKLSHRAIVLSREMLKLAPAAKSEDLVELIPGQEVEVLSKYQDYTQIRLGNQTEGWVNKNTIEQIITSG